MKISLIYIALIFIINNISYSANPDSGLVAFYPFNGNANDESGKGNHGINYGATLTTDRFGRVNNAYSFNHTYIEIPNSASLQSPSNSLTLAFWININQWDNNTAGIMAKSNTGSLGQFGSFISTTPYIQFDLGGQYARITRFFGLNTWYFVCLKWTGQRAILYLNGDAYDSVSFTGAMSPDNNPLILGKHSPGILRYLLGKLDDIRIYNRSLTAAEIQMLYLETNLDINVIPQGFYNPLTDKLRMKDTVKIYLRETTLPYKIMDSLKTVIDSVTFKGSVRTFIPHNSYYIVVKHRNSIETWSSSPEYFEESISYDFTASASQAFGNNQTLSEGKYCIYSGDENQDGAVDVSDGIDIFNDANLFASGYVKTDVDGDNFVDASDMIVTYNNSLNFISVLSPVNNTAECNLSFSRTINWSGFLWRVVSTNDTRCSPGPNYFSSATDNVFVDSAGNLHLKITKRSGKFYCAELFTDEAVGYGNYTFKLSSRVDNLNENVVFGIFTWNDINCETNANSELDIEFTRWGDASYLYPLEYSIQPTNDGQETERSVSRPMIQTGNNSIHFLNWTPELVSFSSYQGHTNPPPPGNLITSWSFNNTNPPKSKEECNSDPIIIPDPENNTTLSVNLWLDRGSYPSDDQEVEVVIKNIIFTPLLYKDIAAEKAKHIENSIQGYGNY